jgi:hypothetical protein
MPQDVFTSQIVITDHAEWAVTSCFDLLVVGSTAFGAPSYNLSSITSLLIMGMFVPTWFDLSMWSDTTTM